LEDDKMKLITKEIENLLPPLRAQEEKGMDAIVYAKFFTPDSNWTWFATEFDPVERLFFGYVCGQENEFGYFSLDELESCRGPFGLPIERDLYFMPTPVSEVRR
jgi:hypothetical protein